MEEQDAPLARFLDEADGDLTFGIFELGVALIGGGRNLSALGCVQGFRATSNIAKPLQRAKLREFLKYQIQLLGMFVDDLQQLLR